MTRECGRPELRRADGPASPVLHMRYSPLGFCRFILPRWRTLQHFDTYPRLYGDDQSVTIRTRQWFVMIYSGRRALVFKHLSHPRCSEETRPCPIFPRPIRLSLQHDMDTGPDLANLPSVTRHTNPKSTSGSNFQPATEILFIWRGALVDDQSGDPRNSNDGEDVHGPRSDTVDGNGTGP